MGDSLSLILCCYAFKCNFGDYLLLRFVTFLLAAFVCGGRVCGREKRAGYQLKYIVIRRTLHITLVLVRHAISMAHS